MSEPSSTPATKTAGILPRTGRVLKWLALGFGALLVAGFLASQIVFVRLHHSLPLTQGTIALAGPIGPIDILRDARGVPHIFAGSRNEAFFAQGFAHAQDRLWQMMMTRRLGQGRMAELAGALALPADRVMRALDLAGVARRNADALPAETRAALDAYAAGVNQFLATRKGPLPPEFVLTGTLPEPWDRADSVLLIKLLALQLSSNAFTEVMRAALLRVVDPATLQALMPDDPGPLPTLETLYETTMPPLEEDDTERPGGGSSNNWVVDGAWTASAKPLLANDPHLGFSLPSIWYLAHLSWGGQNVIGASMPGVPGIVLGRNDAVAWGYTTTGADVQDLVLERIDPQSADHYLTATGSVPFTSRDVTIKVRFAKPVVERFLATVNGPVIPRDLPFVKDIVPDGHVLAARWAGLGPVDGTIAAGLAVLDARTGEEYVAAYKSYVAPVQNMVYADKDGRIGLLVPGHIPIRRPDNPVHGLLPVPGWKPGFDWTGAIPFRALPHYESPALGIIVNANNRVVSEAYPYQISYEWDRDARARRIEALLLSERQHTVASFAAIQMDATSLEAQALLPGLLAVLDRVAPKHALAAAARQRLARWDHEMNAGAAEPLIFAAWMRETVAGIMADEVGPRFRRMAGWDFALVDNVLAGKAAQVTLCDDTSTPAKETCDGVIAAAFDRALDGLVARAGRRMDAWRWGEFHQARHGSQVFSMIPVIGAAFTRSVPTDGGADTINRGLTNFSSRRPFANIHGSTYRAVYDLAEPERSIFMISTGQSGNPLSPHFDDLLEPWARGEYLAMTTDRKALETKGVDLLRLVPAAPR